MKFTVEEFTDSPTASALEEARALELREEDKALSTQIQMTRLKEELASCKNNSALAQKPTAVGASGSAPKKKAKGQKTKHNNCRDPSIPAPPIYVDKYAGARRSHSSCRVALLL